MKTRDRNERDGVQSPAFEDSGVAISGEIGEHSFSGEYNGVVFPQDFPQLAGAKKNAVCRDPRSDLKLKIL